MTTTTKPAKTRIYAVTTAGVTLNGATRLVRATQPSTAISFVVRKQYAATVATQEDIVAAMKAGIQIEDANEAPPAQTDIEDSTTATQAAPTPTPTEAL